MSTQAAASSTNKLSLKAHELLSQIAAGRRGFKTASTGAVSEARYSLNRMETWTHAAQYGYHDNIAHWVRSGLGFSRVPVGIKRQERHDNCIHKERYAT
jgi:hypothetical protein